MHSLTKSFKFLTIILIEIKQSVLSTFLESNLNENSNVYIYIGLHNRVFFLFIKLD